MVEGVDRWLLTFIRRASDQGYEYLFLAYTKGLLGNAKYQRRERRFRRLRRFSDDTDDSDAPDAPTCPATCLCMPRSFAKCP